MSESEPKATIKRVNAELRKLGFAERLVRGKGYFYFADGDAMSWQSSSVYVFDVAALSVSEWIAEYRRLKEF